MSLTDDIEKVLTRSTHDTTKHQYEMLLIRAYKELVKRDRWVHDSNASEKPKERLQVG